MGWGWDSAEGRGGPLLRSARTPRISCVRGICMHFLASTALLALGHALFRHLVLSGIDRTTRLSEAGKTFWDAVFIATTQSPTSSVLRHLTSYRGYEHSDRNVAAYLGYTVRVELLILCPPRRATRKASTLLSLRLCWACLVRGIAWCQWSWQ